MVKCNHGARALKIHVHVKKPKQDAGGSTLWCSHMHFCVNCCSWRVPMHDSLEIKTLCGTWPMIRRKLKQQAEEMTEKRGERREEKKKGERREGKGRRLQGVE